MELYLVILVTFKRCRGWQMRGWNDAFFTLPFEPVYLEFLEKLHLAWNLLKHVKHWGGSKLLLRTSLHFPHNSLDAFASAWVLPCAIRWARLDGFWAVVVAAGAAPLCVGQIQMFLDSFSSRLTLELAVVLTWGNPLQFGFKWEKALQSVIAHL